MFRDITWIFFDVGSTLVDETECYHHRLRDAIANTDITFEEISEKRLFFQKQNLKGDHEAIQFYGLPLTKWHREDEKPYPQAETVLRKLKAGGYQLGIIANQSAGTAERLEKWGLLQYISLVFASAEEGVAKPDAEIFLRALKKAECTPGNAVMIGDRLDNDIFPAKKLGMRTIWVKQGAAVWQYPKNEEYTADFTVEDLDGILELLL